MRVRWIGRVDRTQELVRLFSVLWGRCPSDPGHRCRLSFGLRPRWFSWGRAYGEWVLTIAGLRLHYRGDSRGVFV